MVFCVTTHGRAEAGSPPLLLHPGPFMAQPLPHRRERLRIVLISPKGPLYRHRGGIFGQTLRYMPLTLPTLAALIPDDVPVELTCIDEGIGDVDLSREADLVGMTVITGTAGRAYELAANFRGRGIPVVLGGPHVTLAPDDAAPHADSVVVGYAEESWPQLLRDFAAGRMRRRYNQRPDLDLSTALALLTGDQHYGYCRALGQLGHLKLQRVQNGWETYQRVLLQAGARLGDIKPTGLDTRTDWDEIFGTTHARRTRRPN